MQSVLEESGLIEEEVNALPGIRQVHTQNIFLCTYICQVWELEGKFSDNFFMESDVNFP